jgi:hypothetical protein
MKMRAKPLSAALALAFAFALLFLSSSLAVAQETTAPAADQKKAKLDYALIYGTVWDQNDHPLYGVPIKIRRADQKKAKWELVSDHQGEFAQRVPVGKADYIVWADIRVPKGQQKPETKVHIDYDERRDISLHLTK